MRAALIEKVGEPPRLTDVEKPKRSAGEALIRMETVSLNPVEIHIWAGRFFEGKPELPYVPGVEGVGVVEEGNELAPGTRVRVEVVHPGYGRDGLLAEHVALPERPDVRYRASQSAVFPLQPDVDDVAGAALGATGYSSMMFLDRAVQAGAEIDGAHLAILAGTGAVGACVVQLAKALGAARVIVVGRNAERLERLRQLGADAALELGDSRDLADRLLTASEGRLDIVLDPLWGESAAAAISALGPGGVYVNFGQVASATAPLPSIPLRNKRISLVGVSSGLATPDERREAYERVHEIVSAGRIVLDAEELRLDDLPGAWERLASSAGTKLVVRFGS